MGDPYVGDLLFLARRPSRRSARIDPAQRHASDLLGLLNDLAEERWGLAVTIDLVARHGYEPERDSATAVFLELWKYLSTADRALALVLMKEAGSGPHEVGESMLGAIRDGEEAGRRLKSYADAYGLDPEDWDIAYDIHEGTFGIVRRNGVSGDYRDVETAEEDARFEVRDEADATKATPNRKTSSKAKKPVGNPR